MAALEEAYANQRMVGKFPGCVLHLTTKLNAVDVNVHPTKQEVKFSSERKVFDAVYYAVKSALEGDRTRPAAVLEPPRPHDSVHPEPDEIPDDDGPGVSGHGDFGRPCAGPDALPAGPGAYPHRPGARRKPCPSMTSPPPVRRPAPGPPPPSGKRHPSRRRSAARRSGSA